MFCKPSRTWKLALFSTDALGSVLASHLDKPRVYIGCMKSGEVYSQPWVHWTPWRSHFLGIECWKYLWYIVAYKFFFHMQETKMVWTGLVEIWGWEIVSLFSYQLSLPRLTSFQISLFSFTVFNLVSLEHEHPTFAFPSCCLWISTVDTAVPCWLQY